MSRIANIIYTKHNGGNPISIDQETLGRELCSNQVELTLTPLKNMTTTTSYVHLGTNLANLPPKKHP